MVAHGAGYQVTVIFKMTVTFYSRGGGRVRSTGGEPFPEMVLLGTQPVAFLQTRPYAITPPMVAEVFFAFFAGFAPFAFQSPCA